MDDPRTQPGAYVTDEERLCEVLRVQHHSKNYGLSAGTLGNVIIEDCRTGLVLSIATDKIIGRWRLIRPAPCCPDMLEPAA